MLKPTHEVNSYYTTSIHRRIVQEAFAGHIRKEIPVERAKQCVATSSYEIRGARVPHSLLLLFLVKLTFWRQRMTWVMAL